MIRLKQLIEQINPVNQTIAKQTIDKAADQLDPKQQQRDIKLLDTWYPIVSNFSREFKAQITRPEELIYLQSNFGKNLLSGYVQKSGTLQNGGSEIRYVKIPKKFNFNPKTQKLFRGITNLSEVAPKFILTLKAPEKNYQKLFSGKNHFQLPGEIILNQRSFGGSDISKSFPFYIGLYRSKSGVITYAVAPGAAKDAELGYDDKFFFAGEKDWSNPKNYEKTDTELNKPSHPESYRSGNLKSVAELVRKIEIMLYNQIDQTANFHKSDFGTGEYKKDSLMGLGVIARDLKNPYVTSKK